MKSDTDTVAVLLTGKGRAAVATVLVEGSRATEFVLRFFQGASQKAFTDLPMNAILYGSWQENGEELVICRTAADQVEVHCHGGQLASRKILDALASVGAMELSVDQWFDRQADDPFRVQAGRLLTSARTERTTAILLDQLRGAMTQAMLGIRALIAQGKLADASEQLRHIVDFGDVGLHLATPWSVVFAGLPNAGKSSLINRLLGYERAIVFDQPGTTRDLVSAETAIDGWPVMLTDTAGLRKSEEPIEAMGIQLAINQIVQADLIIVLDDPTQPAGVLDLPTTVAAKHRLNVSTKADLTKTPLQPDAIVTSSVTGQGIEQLLLAIANKLVPSIPPPGAAIPLIIDTGNQLQNIIAEVTKGNVGAAMDLIRRLVPDEI